MADSTNFKIDRFLLSLNIHSNCHCYPGGHISWSLLVTIVITSSLSSSINKACLSLSWIITYPFLSWWYCMWILNVCLVYKSFIQNGMLYYKWTIYKKINKEITHWLYYFLMSGLQSRKDFGCFSLINNICSLHTYTHENVTITVIP